MITPALAFGLYAGVCYLIGYAHGRVIGRRERETEK